MKIDKRFGEVELTWERDYQWCCILTPDLAGPKWRGFGETPNAAYKNALRGKDKFR